MTIHLAIGDASDVTRILGDNSIEGILTDPTYGQNLLGHSWDKVVPPVKVWKEFFRVLKPGGLRMAFGGSRTHHRLMVNLEDAGYLVRECLMWIYAKGYPSSLNLEKAIRKHLDHYPDSRVNHHLWEGYGTKLRSAWEIIVLAQKPLANNYVNNALVWGVGVLNLGGCMLPVRTRQCFPWVIMRVVACMESAPPRRRSPSWRTVSRKLVGHTPSRLPRTRLSSRLPHPCDE